MSTALVAVPRAAGAASPRAPGYGRAFGRVAVFGGRAGGAVALAGALVRAYAPGTAVPWALPLYGDEASEEALVFPLALGDGGEVALWADAPARVELLVQAPGYLPERAVLDLEPPPDAVAVAGDAYTKAESDARYEPLDSAYTKAEADARYAALPLTAGQIPAEFLTQAEGDARYATLPLPPPEIPPEYVTEAELGAALSGYLTPAAADALFLTPAEGGAAYAALDHSHPQVTTGRYHFQTNPAMTKPGAGNFRSNTGAAATATALALDELGALGTDITPLFRTMREADTIFVQDLNDADQWVRYQLTGAPTLNSGWAVVPVAVVSSGGTIAGSQLCVMQLTLTAGGGGGGGGSLVTGDAVWDAKGDLAVGSGPDAGARLAVGADGHVLTADSAQTLGVRWAAPAAGGTLATDPLADAKGDLFAASAADAVGRLPLGTDGHVLTADSAQALGVKWAAAGGAGSYLPTTGGTMTGAVVLQGASSTTNVLQAKASADANQRFRVNASGLLEWTNQTTGAVQVSLNPSATDFKVLGDWTPATTVAYRLGTTTLVWQALYARDLIARSDTGYLEVGVTNPAAAGAVRLRNAGTVSWRNAGNTADLSLTMNASDRLALTVGASALTTTVGAAGAAAALPATPTGYLTVVLNGATVKVPYYAS